MDERHWSEQKAEVWYPGRPCDEGEIAAMNDEIATYGRRCYARPAGG